MDFRLSRVAYLADFVLVPLYIASAVISAFVLATPTREWFFLFCGGVTAWTLTEYVVHRWLFHIFYKTEHWRHHRNPLEWIGLSPLVTGGSLALVYLLALYFGWGTGGMLFAGFAYGYFAYILIHYLIHHTSNLTVYQLRKTHEIHHAGVERNFGVSTNLWDHIFRTYTDPFDKMSYPS
jgi:dihydroceramide fatty acyl 2-hydroxylase